jgi:release factor glutamine methyltransferase
LSLWDTGAVRSRAVLTDEVCRRLTAVGCVAAAEEAAELVERAPDAAGLERWVRRREEGEPLAWITGGQEFCGRRLRVDPGVYVPRRQTEALARRAAGALAAGDGWAADLCTGSGAVAAHLLAAVPGAVVIGTDIDRLAAACARRNGVRAVVGDGGAPLASGVFDVVTAVAPYVPSGAMHLLPRDVRRFEPRRALDGGIDGLAVVRTVVAGAVRLLRPEGWLFLEVGADQDHALEPELSEAGLDLTQRWWDEDGDLRGVAARHSGVVSVR